MRSRAGPDSLELVDTYYDTYQAIKNGLGLRHQLWDTDAKRIEHPAYWTLPFQMEKAMGWKTREEVLQARRLFEWWNTFHSPEEDAVSPKGNIIPRIIPCQLATGLKVIYYFALR